MLSVREPDERIVAVLHDVVEDSEWTFERLAEAGFSATVIKALKALTKLEGEAYEAFIQRAKANRIARRVKLADIADNSDLSRIPQPSTEDHWRVEKYRRATAALEL